MLHGAEPTTPPEQESLADSPAVGFVALERSLRVAGAGEVVGDTVVVVLIPATVVLVGAEGLGTLGGLDWVGSVTVQAETPTNSTTNVKLTIVLTPGIIRDQWRNAH